MPRRGRNVVVGGPHDPATAIDELFAAYRSDPRVETRNRLILEYEWLAERCARRYRGRGEHHDDLVQVASIGLIKAVERFDPERGVDFAAFAAPTILGELRRYFRDLSWRISVPRRNKEIRDELRGAVASLEQQLGRAPMLGEVASYLRIDGDALTDALRADRAYGVASLEAFPQRAEWRGDDLALTGEEYEHTVEATGRLDAIKAISKLPERDRKILYWRYFEECTQREIGERLGLGQAQVSRLLHDALSHLRGELAAPDGRDVA
jgi:RNA polymerase sigma-B factor